MYKSQLIGLLLFSKQKPTITTYTKTWYVYVCENTENKSTTRLLLLWIHLLKIQNINFTKIKNNTYKTDIYF